MTFSQTTVRPIIEGIFSFITQTVVPVILQTITAAAPSIASIISGVGSVVMTVAQIIGEAIQFLMPIIQTVITVLMHIGQVVVPAVLAAIGVFAEGISSAINATITMLNVRKKGQGKEGHKKPVLFPKLVFLYDENLHGPGKEGEDVFEAGISCSAKTMYPDWLSMTGKGYISSMYKQYKKVISPMGCRAFLSPWLVFLKSMRLRMKSDCFLPWYNIRSIPPLLRI